MIADPASPGGWTGAVTIFQPDPKMRSPPASATVHPSEVRHSTSRRPATARLPRTASASMTVVRRFSFGRPSAKARWIPSMKKDAASSSVRAVPASKGAPRTSSPMSRVKPVLAYAERRAFWLTRRKLWRPSSTPDTSSTVPTSCSDDEAEKSGAAAASPARTSATVPSTTRPRLPVPGDGAVIAVLRGARGQEAAQRLDLLEEGRDAAAHGHRCLVGEGGDQLHHHGSLRRQQTGQPPLEILQLSEREHAAVAGGLGHHREVYREAAGDLL